MRIQGSGGERLEKNLGLDTYEEAFELLSLLSSGGETSKSWPSQKNIKRVEVYWLHGNSHNFERRV